MEKFSRWRDPGTGIQPFLPLQASSTSPLISIVLLPLRTITCLIRSLLLVITALLYLLLVEGVCLILIPAPPLYRTISGLCTSLTTRLALLFMGYIWITPDLASPKRGSSSIVQAVRPVRKGDLIITNWTSYVDILYLAFRYNPVFLLPVFTPATDEQSGPITGRHTGTGSAQISTSANLPQPPFLGYKKYTLPAVLSQTGSLPEVYSTLPESGLMYRTLKEARKREKRPICVFPEGTTSNGRAVLRISEGVLGDGDVGKEDAGIVWVTFFKHPAPSSSTPSATCPLPIPLSHLIVSLLSTPTPFHTRSIQIRTLHPSNSPSAPSFLPSEILANAPGGLEGVGRDGNGAWREAVTTVLAETGKVRRVKGMGWVEKAGFLEYWNKVKR